jgi:hypothetical protein
MTKLFPGFPNTLYQAGIRREIENIFNACHLNQLPRLPKGVRMWRVRSRRNAMLDTARVSIKSKGRTGARVRMALAVELRTKTIYLPKKYKGRYYI